jgi:pterin-4a-carbinolamine dehydratase
MVQAQVFISYRRDTDKAYAHMLRLLIDRTFNSGAERIVGIFLDTHTRLGVEWPEEIKKGLAEANIVLVVIGPKWLGATGQYDRRRIDQKDDWVRREIELALKHDKTVIPAAFEVDMPPKKALPPSIRNLADRQGVRIHDVAYLERDLQPVFLAIEEHLGHRRSHVAKSATTTALPYPDPPLPVVPAPMTDAEIQQALEDMLSGWEVQPCAKPKKPTDMGIELHRVFHFRSFREVLQFMTEVGDFAEKMNHHPRWENIYRTLYVYIAHGISTTRLHI